MNLRQLYYFKKLAEKEHYTIAAAELSITQPSLSHSIAELERELGVYLFEKQGRNIRLTKYGRFYLTYVEKSLAELEKGEKLLHELTSPSHGNIDLGFIYTMAPIRFQSSSRISPKSKAIKTSHFPFSKVPLNQLSLI